MDLPVRIAVVGPVADEFLAELTALPLPHEVRRWATLSAAGSAIVPFQAEVLVLQLDPAAPEEIGGLRLLRGLWPSLGVVLVTDAAHELQHAPLAQRLEVQLLVWPGAPGQLAAALDMARQGRGGPRPEVFQDLARGVADEINNPLLFVAGHLQLLHGNLDPHRDAAARGQVDAALAGLGRVQTAVDRLRLVAEAAHGPVRTADVDLAALLAQAVAARKPHRRAATLRIAEAPHVVTGDPEQLAAAVRTLVQFADDLTELGAHAHIELDALPGSHRLRLTASGHQLASFQVPHGFEPFYPSRALRTPGLGLGPFLLQTVFLGHRGQASVRRTRDGALQFDFVLPV